MPNCRQVGHWAKECPNRDKSPKTAGCKCCQLGHWVALCTGDPRASRSSTKPSIIMVQKDWSGPLQLARLSQITITGLEPRMQWDVAGSSERFLVTQGLTTLSWSPTPETSPKPVPFWVLQEKQLQEIHLSTLLLGWTNIFPPVSSGPWLSSSLIWRNLSLPLTPCSYWSPERRYFKIPLWGQTIFTSHQWKNS